MLGVSDRLLRVLAPVVVQANRDTPHPFLEELVDDLRSMAKRRHLAALLAEMDRIAAGGELNLPQPERVTYERVVASV